MRGARDLQENESVHEEESAKQKAIRLLTRQLKEIGTHICALNDAQHHDFKAWRDTQFATTEEARLETVLLRDFPLYHDFYVIALDTGMRTGEQLEMTWDRVDFTRRQVSIHRSKTGKGRSIPLTTRALAAFQRLYDRPLRGEHCFLSLNGARAQSVKHWFNEAVKTAGVREFTPYSLRHTFGARLATADVSMLKLSKLMGNSAAICERYYAHLAPSSLQEAVSRLNPPQSTKKSTTQAVGKSAVQ